MAERRRGGGSSLFCFYAISHEPMHPNHKYAYPYDITWSALLIVLSAQITRATEGDKSRSINSVFSCII